MASPPAPSKHDFMSPDAVQDALERIGDIKAERAQARRPFTDEAPSKEEQARLAKIDEMPKTWRSGLPIFRDFEYWRMRADTFPYITRSDAMDNFFLRGVTVHPRLSDYPMCKDVIRDYFFCREDKKHLVFMNICSPVKEQLSACLNEVFVKRCERANKKALAKRDELHEENARKKTDRLEASAQKNLERRSKFQD